MSKISLTDVYLRNLKPTGSRFEISDAATTGLRVRVSPTGQISFLAKVRDATGRLSTVTLGHYPDISLKAARDEAVRKRLDLKAGRDINAEKKAKRELARTSSAAPTLRELLREFEQTFGRTKKVWAPVGPKSDRTQAGRVVERVFAKLLDSEVAVLGEEELAKAISSYRRVNSTNGQKSATGQASRARAYLGPVLDWAAGRKAYAKIGASRIPRLDVASLANVHDPAAEDPSVTGKRTRVLTQDELHAILPLLNYPAPQIGVLRSDPALDFRPVAMRFILFTAARLDEVCQMRWRDLDRRNGVWRKPQVKSTKGGSRSQDLPLSPAAIDILRQLPGWAANRPDALVFPNGTGNGPLGNWDRFQRSICGATSTSEWHRHDLRRTAATLMHSLKVPVSTIEQILAHTQPLRAENASGAASHYLQLTQIMTNSRDPQEEALTILAEALNRIEEGSI